VKKHLLTAVFALVVGTLGFAVSGVALANNGNGRGGPNPCPPSEHAVYDQNGNFVGCEHNGNPSGEPGGGIGNCGQNQSGNPGNGGDTGYGNGSDCVVTTTETTPTETTPSDTTPTDTTPTDTTPTDTTPGDTTPGDTTPGDTTPSDTTPTETTSSPSPGTPPADGGSQPGSDQSSQQESTTSTDSSSPSIVGQPPEEQHSTKQVGPAQAQQSSAKPAVAGTGAKNEPKPTREPQPAPFTL
jgi:hypothetical protein